MKLRTSLAAALMLTGDALDFLRRTPGRNAARIADVLQVQGQALRVQGQWDDAISTLREALDLARGERVRERGEGPVADSSLCGCGARSQAAVAVLTIVRIS